MKSSHENEQNYLNIILLLFVLLHVTLILLFTPQGLFNAYTDTHHYYNTALLSEQGYYPLVNMWYEYPPLTAYWVQGVYAVVRQGMPLGDINSLTYDLFARLLRLSLLLPECGILILIHRLGRSAWGMQRANWLAWVYLGLSGPLFYSIFSHQNLATFFGLLALDLALQPAVLPVAGALGLGILAKLTPAYLLGPIARQVWPDWRKIAGYGLGAGLVTVAGYLPFVLQGGGAWVAASFRALLGGPSYRTVWALLDGNWGPGEYGPLSTRTDLAQAAVVHGNPPALPTWLPLLLFGALYAYLFFRPYRPSPGSLLRFSALTAVVFHLWSKGWSPQWMVALIPLVLLALPDRRGVGAAVGLTLISWLEWPLGDAFNSHALLAASIILRTGLLVWLLWQLLSDKSRIAEEALIG